MAKMRVHELAKELEIESKSIVEFLKGTEYEVKAAASSVEDAAQEMVRKKFGKKGDGDSPPLYRNCLFGIQSQPLGGFFAHFIFQHLASGIHGEFVNKFDVSGNFVTCHAGLNVIAHFRFC